MSDKQTTANGCDGADAIVDIKIRQGQVAVEYEDGMTAERWSQVALFAGAMAVSREDAVDG